MSDEPETVRFFPELHWHERVIWRGDLVSSRDEGHEAAETMSACLHPIVTGTGKPAIAVERADGEQLVFEIDWADNDSRFRFLSPIQRAATVVADMTCGAGPETAWEPAVISGEHVIWAPYYPAYVPQDLALEQSAKALLDHLRPSAFVKYRGDRDGGADEWEPYIEHRSDHGRVDNKRIAVGNAFSSKTLAWRHAARVLADAEATARKAPTSEPLVTVPLSAVA